MKPRLAASISADAYERAASIFRAMGDTPRLRMLHLLAQGELCVSDLVEQLREKFSTVSQRLKTLRQEGLVVRRREGTHLYYALADQHVADLLANALDHACELTGSTDSTPEPSPEGEK
jgi:ArsR family transcriptional regulator